MSSQLDKEKAKKNITVILDKVKNEADPRLLNEYRSLFKKEVSLFRRPWVTSYLLMLYDQGALGQGGRFRKSGAYPPVGMENRGASFKPGRKNGNSENGTRGDPARYPLSEEESRWLFISVGRNRRIFPREILGLISTKASVSREDIGAIRILDNYSFVQVRDTKADGIIEALNRQLFRGRTLTVNYAKTRKEESGEDDGTADSELTEYPGLPPEGVPEEYAESNAESDEIRNISGYAKDDSEQDEGHPDKENI
ncbi:MAG: DbpA RNA binding domain-containing protein [Treponema sp.]|jgi:hypothetical protein|nr:DbpA RNA binding domain-containing protein [Treponema sp.]